MLLRYTLQLNDINISFIYYILLIIVAILFVLKFKLKKPGTMMIYFMVGIGAIEFIAVVVLRMFGRY